MKVLVTGSAGKLGAAVVIKLRTENVDVVGADLLPGVTTDIVLDIRNQDEVLKACQHIDAIIHTAALYGKHYELNFPRKEFLTQTFTAPLTCSMLQLSITFATFYTLAPPLFTAPQRKTLQQQFGWMNC